MNNVNDECEDEQCESSKDWSVNYLAQFVKRKDRNPTLLISSAPEANALMNVVKTICVFY